MKTYVEINSVDVSDFVVKWNTIELFGQEVSKCKLEIVSAVKSVVSLEVGQSVIIKRGEILGTEQYIFQGTIDKITYQGGRLTLLLKDLAATLLKRQVTYSYDKNIDTSAGVGSAIAQDLIETYGGMSATVVSTGSTILISKFICNNISVFDAVKQIADIYDYMFYYDTDDSTIHFEPKGYTASTNSLAVGTNIKNLPKWEKDMSLLVNKIKVLGAEQIVEDTETFDGTGAANQQNTLSKIPISVNASIGGVEQAPGIDGVTSGSYDYEIDKENKKILWNQGTNPGVGVGNISITYTRSIPIPVIVRNETSESNYGTVEASKHFSNIQTLDDAEQMGRGFLTRYSEPFLKTTLEVLGYNDYEVGQTVGVTDVVNNITATVVINQLERTYPHGADKLIVGDREWKVAEWGKLTMDRIKRLEELTNKNTDLIVEIKDFSNNVSIAKRYLQALSKTYNGTGLVWGHPIYGTWNSYTWEVDTFGSEVQQRLVWQDQTYIENFVDTDFEGVFS